MVVGREAHLDTTLFAGPHAVELLCETGDEAGAAELDADVTAGATLKGHAVDGAYEIDRQHVALGGAAVLGDIDHLPLALGDASHHGVNHVWRHF